MQKLIYTLDLPEGEYYTTVNIFEMNDLTALQYIYIIIG